MTTPVGVVMRRAAQLAASRLGGESGSREARPEVERAPVTAVPSVLRSPSCTYCGRKPRNASVTCHAHSDLPAIDPFFSPDVPQRTEPAEDFRPEALLDRLQPIGA